MSVNAFHVGAEPSVFQRNDKQVLWVALECIRKAKTIRVHFIRDEKKLSNYYSDFHRDIYILHPTDYKEFSTKCALPQHIGEKNNDG